ncbi:MAG: molybdopterin-dependent oxidoreductase [Proteobacteria bacterium]|nr:molybdopterin-dependent oxidoreductase [Pseudomonadota bacterium]
MPESLDTNTITKDSVCGICPSGCGVTAHFKEGRFERMTPLKNHPLGIVCPRGGRASEIVYSEDRLAYPQRRTSKGLERVSWDDAYEIWIGAMEKISRQYGPEALCHYTGRGNFEFGLNEFFAPSGTSETSANAVLFPFGSPNVTGVGSLCYAAQGMIAPQASFGRHMRGMQEDLENADLILVWGANPITDSPPVNMRRIKQAKRNGARVVVIDHRRSETARAVNAEWIGIRPGTDGALALGALHVMIKEGIFDRAFVTDWTHGFEELCQYVEAFSPEHVASITGISARVIRDLARSVATASGCSILMYTGLEYSNSGVQAIRAVWILQAIGGHLDVPGGKQFKMNDRLLLDRMETNPPADARPPIGFEEFPLYHATRKEAHAALLPKAILEGDPYPIRGMIISGASIITSWPNPGRWRKALAALDFLVVVDRFPTADAEFADLVLPATTMFENESYAIHDGYIQLRSRVLEPQGEARNDYLIFTELARRLGYGERWPQTEAEKIAWALRNSPFSVDDLRKNPAGLTFDLPKMRYRKYQSGEIRPDGKPGFLTKTGKFELVSEWFRDHGYDPLPVYTEPCEGPLANPGLARQYPLVFNSGARTQFAFRSQHYNIPSLLVRQPKPLVQMHSKDAAKRGIADGDPVDVVSPRGRVRFWAEVSEHIVEGVVEVNMGGGGGVGAQEWRQANVNELTDPENYDPISGFPVFKALLCDVEKAG